MWSDFCRSGSALKSDLDSSRAWACPDVSKESSQSLQTKSASLLEMQSSMVPTARMLVLMSVAITLALFVEQASWPSLPKGPETAHHAEADGANACDWELSQ